MVHQSNKHIRVSRAGLIIGLLLALVSGGGIVYLLQDRPIVSPSVTQLAPSPLASPQAPTQNKAPPKTIQKPTAPKSQAVTTKPATNNHQFIIQGLLSNGGEPWVANTIMIKILWLKNKDQRQFLPGQETSVVQATQNGFAYRIQLRPQTAKFLNWNGGVEGNVGRVIAFLDLKRDGRLTPGQDKIIAVSKELVRYRTGRFDNAVLKGEQLQNIKQAGKGYVLVRNMQLGDKQADWQVVASKSPARLDLNATETSLPSMYNTFLKMQ